VAKLAELRSEEGYMADWRVLPDGSYVLSENHCPICAAARLCQGFCRSELAVFRSALGPSVTVERAEHILLGARRCAYRIGAKT
jgi:predicted ArsR family transcriptional regulator